MFLEEARLAARVRHPNVVPALDVVSLNEEILLVMDYVHGETLSRLVRVATRLGEHVPPRVAVGIMCGALEGLHAAHEAKSEKGNPLGLVHRDVSPQNIMVGTDGVTRVLDFGVAKATAKRTETRGDLIKGKAAYMAPEQLVGGIVDPRADIFGASVCLWQALTGERLFMGDSFEAIAQSVVTEPIRPPSQISPNIPRALDEVLMKGLDREAEHRWPTAREMAIQLERALQPATVREIGAWVDRIAGDRIHARARVVAQIERVSIASINLDGFDEGPASKREEDKIPSLVESAGSTVPGGTPPTVHVPGGSGQAHGQPQNSQGHGPSSSAPPIFTQAVPPPNAQAHGGAQGPNGPASGHGPPTSGQSGQHAGMNPSGPGFSDARDSRDPRFQSADAAGHIANHGSQGGEKKSNLKLTLSVVGLTIGVGIILLLGMIALQERAAARAADSAQGTDTTAPSPPPPPPPMLPQAPSATGNAKSNLPPQGSPKR